MNTQTKGPRVKDKVAIVTGGGSGIGEATSKLLAQEGASVMVADLDETAAKRVASEIEKGGGQAVAAKVDVTQKGEVEKVVRDTLAGWGKIDILVNNAGGLAIDEMRWFIETDESMWDNIIARNLKGTLLFTHAVLPSMMERKYGRIVNIASSAGKVGAGKQAVYSGAKAGVDGFTKALAREVARYGISVNDICPGPIHTPAFGQLREQFPELEKAFVQGTVVRRLGTPEEIAAAALFLASDESSFVTGHSLLVDGGITMI